MNQARSIAIVLGLGLALVSGFALAQDPQAQPPQPAAAVPQIPPDQQPTKAQLATLFEAMRLRKQLEDVMNTMPAMVEQQVREQMKEMLSATPGGSQLTPAQQAAFEKLMDKYLERARNLYPANEMIDDMATLYQRHLSRTDVDAYIAFYRSPPGQHLLDAQPVIMREYAPVVMSRYQERSKQLYADMENDVQEFIKSEFPPAAGSGPAGSQPTQDKPPAK
jgi:uncharacterized protein